jgi:2',3'-cyclic-nucleotide 2'-phosphodiesterase (5'-nucleotidase family)
MTFVKQQRQEAEHLLLFDTGDALIGDGVLGNETMGEAIVAGMNLMGYDAMALGPEELSLGAALLRQRMQEAQFPMLSANVLRRDTKKPVSEAYVVLEVGSYRVGVIGLTRQPGEDLADFEVLDPQESVAGYVPEVVESADTVVLLTNLGYRAAVELVQSVPDIGLVVAALPRQLPESAARVPGTNTLAVTAEQALSRHAGRRVGRLAVTLGSDGSLSGEKWSSMPMGPDIADDPEMKILLDSYRQP